MEYFPFVIAILGLLFPLVLLPIIFGFESRSEARFHDTLKSMIESGQTLDEQTLSGIPGYKKKGPRNDVRSGLITTGTGLGIALLGKVALGSVIFGAGLLVLCIGASIAAYGLFGKHLSAAATRSDQA
ncbi:hypothetical protein GCM10008090_18530 [Arenicella chitinivorans]|uniref:DUF6249 domain-containing protein n=1 Tax=Arenicella chitinivorans TaxID=1329800 RepID=A0A918RRY8_9GAMM|nr:DUF6249 domain-containing protein [Arenicella chitinivorans]GHA08920.1 hypothetical protein GCM10008090_18530 [Arenicella chitinivorans]